MMRTHCLGGTTRCCPVCIIIHLGAGGSALALPLSVSGTVRVPLGGRAGVGDGGGDGVVGLIYAPLDCICLTWSAQLPTAASTGLGFDPKGIQAAALGTSRGGVEGA